MSRSKDLNSLAPRTQMALMNRGFPMKESSQKTVNPPIYRASTFLFDTYGEMTQRETGDDNGRFPYGLFGTDTVRQLEQMVAQLEGTDDAVASCSGLSACSIPFLTFLGTGDHVLITDSVYGPVRQFADNHLVRMGIDVEYYDPLVSPDALGKQLKPNTKMIYLESPGSATFEIQDVKGLAALAKQHNLITALDSTWSTPVYYRPAEHGVDLVIHAATKFFGGASDLMLGIVAGSKELVDRMAKAQGECGFYTNPDDAYACMRGLRTLATRMPVHLESSLLVAKHLSEQPEVADILHPALPGDRMHQRFLDQGFTGGGSLFSVVFQKNIHKDFVAKLAEALRLFGMGYSWGGFESLVSAQNPRSIRTASPWPRQDIAPGLLLRFYIGLEDPFDICQDITQAFDQARGTQI